MSFLSASVWVGLSGSVQYFVELAIWLVPLFLLASFLVGLVEEYVPPERLRELLERQSGPRGIVTAGVGGALTPFCSCASIPVVAGLLQAGAPLSIAMAFLVASPLINEIAILLLVGIFSLKIAVYYVAITFGALVVFGLIVGRFDVDTHVKVGPTIATDGGQSATGSTSEPQPRSHWEHFFSAIDRASAFVREMSPYLVLGMVLGAILHSFVPADWIRVALGANNSLGVPIATVIGAPMYVSISAVLPIASSLADQGVPIGTVLAFVIGGAGVSIPNLVLLNKFFDKYLLSLYVLAVIAIGVLVGMVFNYTVV